MWLGPGSVLSPADHSHVTLVHLDVHQGLYSLYLPYNHAPYVHDYALTICLSVLNYL